LTLIELLVVLGAIAVLLAVSVSVLTSARGAARSAVCASSLRQVHAGVIAYRENHKGAMPIALDPADLRSGRAAPFDALAEFVGVAPPSLMSRGQPWVCPSDRRAGVGAGLSRSEAFLGVSYYYQPIDLVYLLLVYPAESRPARLGKLVADRPDEPLFLDDEPRHAGQRGVNVLWLDGSVSQGYRR
jgi:prepilin-type processing-associated H-X9-DG protein